MLNLIIFSPTVDLLSRRFCVIITLELSNCSSCLLVSFLFQSSTADFLHRNYKSRVHVCLFLYIFMYMTTWHVSKLCNLFDKEYITSSLVVHMSNLI